MCKLKPKIEEICQKRNLKYSVERNQGRILVELSQETELTSRDSGSNYLIQIQTTSQHGPQPIPQESSRLLRPTHQSVLLGSRVIDETAPLLKKYPQHQREYQAACRGNRGQDVTREESPASRKYVQRQPTNQSAVQGNQDHDVINETAPLLRKSPQRQPEYQITYQRNRDQDVIRGAGSSKGVHPVSARISNRIPAVSRSEYY
jgi:hypothetical protein